MYHQNQLWVHLFFPTGHNSPTAEEGVFLCIDESRVRDTSKRRVINREWVLYLKAPFNDNDFKRNFSGIYNQSPLWNYLNSHLNEMARFLEVLRQYSAAPIGVQPFCLSVQMGAVHTCFPLWYLGCFAALTLIWFYIISFLLSTPLVQHPWIQEAVLVLWESWAAGTGCTQMPLAVQSAN